MRGRWLVGLVAGAVAVAGCGHGSMSEQGAVAGAEVASTFDDAYQSVTAGGKSIARWGEYVVQRTSEGAVRVYRSTRTSVGGDLSDAMITARVKSRLAGDPMVHSMGISVETDAGVVTLKGHVPDHREAARAVEDALTADGVYGVNSLLTPAASQATEQPPGQM